MPLDVSPGTTAYERNAPDAHLVTSSLAGSRPAPFWLEDLPSRPARPALHGERSCELLVVGGGYTGLWTAVQAKLRELNSNGAPAEVSNEFDARTDKPSVVYRRKGWDYGVIKLDTEVAALAQVGG